MFNFFKKKSGKAEAGAENSRGGPSTHRHTLLPSVQLCAPRHESDVTTDRKDVVNLLIPETDYSQKTGVGGLFKIMTRKKNKRTESVNSNPPKEMYLQRSKSERELKQTTPTDAKNTQGGARASPADDPADFVRALVLQKYAKPETKHVSVTNPNLDEKRHAEALLREIARSIDCTIDEITGNKTQMGAADSKNEIKEPVYETVEEKKQSSSIDAYKSGLKGELEKLLQNDSNKIETPQQKKDYTNEDTRSLDSSGSTKKSNLKPPKSDTEGCSDDDRSESNKKKVTFRKHIVFDDGDEQTDEGDDSSFESLTSGEEEEYLEELPDNDELLGGYVVSRNENKTVTSSNEDEKVDDRRCDNSDSGFVDDRHCEDDVTSEVKTIVEESESESGSETEDEIIEVIEEEICEESYEDSEESSKIEDDEKSLVSQESKFQSQVAALTELAETRCGETERARELIATYRKEIESKDQEIERLKCELSSAYKESELVRQRGRALEEELAAARTCSAELADQLRKKNDESIRQLKAELEDALTQRAELESKVIALERDRDRLLREKEIQEQRAQEALAAAEANTAKWRAAHESARSQAAARAERMLADCEWKMRELERRARDAEKQKKQLAETVEELKNNPQPSPAQVAELQQLRGVVSEQQRSVQSLTLKLQKVETREEALKLEVHRLKELLEKETRIGQEKEERHLKTIERLEQQHTKAVESLKAEHTASAASTRAALERAHAERTRAALAQLREEAEKDARNADRKLREVTTRFENLKEELANKEAQFDRAISEAHSKADWDIMQLRHLLDKADITYANNVEAMNEKFEKEKEQLIAEWSEKLHLVEEQAKSAAEEARKLLEKTRMSLVAEKNDVVHKLKEKHKLEMEEQWEQFMTDKENCLARMKAECRQEGEEERVKREKELIEEIAELKAQIQNKSADFDTLAGKAAAVGRTLAVTEQELREALAREKDLREKRSEDATRLRQVERSSRDQVEHLTRKCACLRKLFDDIRARLSAKEKEAEQEARAREKELHHLRAEVARLTKILVEESTPKLARTRADGCESQEEREPARRKGGTLRTPELARKRPTLPDLTPLPPQARQTAIEFQNGRRRAKSVDLPAVQVPVRIKQLQEKTKE